MSIVNLCVYVKKTIGRAEKRNMVTKSNVKK